MATKKINRSAKDGKFVTKKNALENPDTTVTETVVNLRKELESFCAESFPEMEVPFYLEKIDKYLSKK